MEVREREPASGESRSLFACGFAFPVTSTLTAAPSPEPRPLAPCRRGSVIGLPRTSSRRNLARGDAARASAPASPMRLPTGQHRQPAEMRRLGQRLRSVRGDGVVRQTRIWSFASRVAPASTQAPSRAGGCSAGEFEQSLAFAGRGQLVGTSRRAGFARSRRDRRVKYADEASARAPLGPTFVAPRASRRRSRFRQRAPRGKPRPRSPSSLSAIPARDRRSSQLDDASCLTPRAATRCPSPRPMVPSTSKPVQGGPPASASVGMPGRKGAGGRRRTATVTRSGRQRLRGRGTENGRSRRAAHAPASRFERWFASGIRPFGVASTAASSACRATERPQPAACDERLGRLPTWSRQNQRAGRDGSVWRGIGCCAA